ncbi:hypothetical protein GOP47_0012303 [Adiantum capillus-veneris]|uniref:Uncharacterized protein n=1 Tax=Adiantum capillus-veneris TaxID=13818 RepID=A0A9D4UQX8_ADICA|nr:hypothetical protein GOP47_0012303 [Adiantum capillus-veneris]
MADSPGKVLSSFTSSNEKKGDTSKVGGCAGVFFQLFDRFNGRKFLPHKLLPSERSKHITISHTEEKLPMAKLLLIADEKRIAASKKEKETLSDELIEGNENHEGRREMHVSVVAKLMGLETMPSSKISRERKQARVLKDEAEALSARKPLQKKKVPGKRVQRNTKAMDIRMQSTKRATKPSHTDHLCGLKLTGSTPVTDGLKHPSVRSKLIVKSRSSATITQMNSRKGEDSRTFIFTKFSLPTIQIESQLRSILSPSRTSNKVLSPIKSPLSSRSAARLFGAAVKVLEPNLRPARQLGFSLHNANSASHGNCDEDNKKRNSTLIASKRLVQANAPFTDCKGQVTSKYLNPSPEKIRQLSPNHATRNRHPNAREGVRKTLPYVKHEKRPHKIVSGKKQSLVTDSCKLEANDSTSGGCSLRTSSTSNKTSANSTQMGNKQENTLVTEGGMSSVQGPHMSIASHGAGSAKDANHGMNVQPLRFERSQRLTCPLDKLAKNTIQEGSRNNFKARFANDSKSTILGKTSSTGAPSRTNEVQSKRESSCSGSSSKRKASRLSPKSALLSDVARAVVGDLTLQTIENERRIKMLALEKQSVSPQSDSNVPDVCYDGCNMTSSIEADSKGRTRVRAKWEVTDERKKSLTMSRISCNVSQSTSSSVGNNRRGDSALEADIASVGLLHGPFLSLNAPTSRSWCSQFGTNEHNLFCNDGSEAMNYCSTLHNKESRDLNVCSSKIDGYLGGVKQQSSNDSSTPLKEDSCAQDSESISGSLCAEECEQPSPISILDSPFHDSASCSSDSFEGPQGFQLWEAVENENLDYLSTVENHVESPGILTQMSQLHSIDSRSSDVDAKNKPITEYEEKYMKKILGTVLHSAELAVWERLALSGPLIDPLIYYELEESHKHTQGARMSTSVCEEFDHERDHCYGTTFAAWCKEGTPQQRKLYFDCIEVALGLSLELAMQSYGFLLPFLHFSPAYLQKAVHKHLGEWKGLALSMNLDDMMTVEINSGMARWLKYGDEVEIVAANMETIIFNSLIDEVTEDALKDVEACCVCR